MFFDVTSFPVANEGSIWVSGSYYIMKYVFMILSTPLSKFGHIQLGVVNLFVRVDCSHLHLAAPPLHDDIKILR